MMGVWGSLIHDWAIGSIGMRAMDKLITWMFLLVGPVMLQSGGFVAILRLHDTLARSHRHVRARVIRAS